jgi:hypothetical protein
LKDLEENEDNISSVKRMKKEEKRIKRNRNKNVKGNVFTAQHEEAARVLIRHLRNFIRANRLAKGIKVRRYTKEELDAIDAAVMNQFKRMVEVEEPEQSPEPNMPPNTEREPINAVAKPTITPTMHSKNDF